MIAPRLTRYEDTQLESMLYSYRLLAREHLDSGHFALAAWATRMVTLISIELNLRAHKAEVAASLQLSLLEQISDAS